ncbi:MAG: cupin domain-containing protein [Candidatus Methanomethylicus sp.]|nr:cupin domain-containing protein [Candidatus Methanomethylicus sp.]
MTLQKKNFQKPDEIQTYPNLRVENIRMGDLLVSKQTYQPGWRWSKDIKPIAKTETCQAHHFGIWVAGRVRVKAGDGQEIEYGPGDVADIPPGHDGWVVGNEPAVFYAFTQKASPK